MNNELKKLVGQLIIAGFRDNFIDENSKIVNYIKDFNLAGIILYDEDLEIGGIGSRNISSPNQLKKLIRDLKQFPIKMIYLFQ